MCPCNNECFVDGSFRSQIILHRSFFDVGSRIEGNCDGPFAPASFSDTERTALTYYDNTQEKRYSGGHDCRSFLMIQQLNSKGSCFLSPYGRRDRRANHGHIQVADWSPTGFCTVLAYSGMVISDILCNGRSPPSLIGLPYVSWLPCQEAPKAS